MIWYLKGSPFDSYNIDISEFIGFVYLITEKDTDMKYIGKKLFWNKQSKIVKGRKNRKISKVESNWRNYYGSSLLLQEEVKIKGEDNYHREILRLCKTKGECSYYEAKAQFDNDVLLRDDYYNKYIQCRINASHLK